MKKIFLILFSFALLAIVGCSQRTETNPDPPGVKVEYAVDQPVQANAIAADVYVVQDTAEQPPGEAEKTFLDILKENWGALLLGFLAFVEILVRLTPSEKDNSILNMIIKFLNVLLPNLKKGGGKFEVRTG
jgi:hypothetical protein